MSTAGRGLCVSLLLFSWQCSSMSQPLSTDKLLRFVLIPQHLSESSYHHPKYWRLSAFPNLNFLTNCNSNIFACSVPVGTHLRNKTNTNWRFHWKVFSPTESSPPWASPLVSITNNSPCFNSNNLTWWLVVWIGSRVYMWK